MAAKRYILPGMGADERMYNEQWKTRLPGTYISWPRFSGEESLNEIADSLIAMYRITDGDILIGSSLGGMVASQISEKIHCSRLVLLGSAVSPLEVSKLLALLHPLIDTLPISLSQISASSLRGALTESFAEADPKFLRAMTRAIFKWSGLKDSRVRPYRIHGRFDLVIPPPDDCDLLLNGGHMIAMTHAEECITAIEAIRA